MEKSKVNFLYLSQEDMVKAGVLNMNRCISVIEEGFELVSNGDYLAGGPNEHDHGMQIWFPSKARGEKMPVKGPDRRFLAMVGYLGGRFNICGTKWYGSNIENREKRGLPRSILLVILNDPESGAPVAIMDGNLISAMRTGAVSGVAAKYLSKDDSKVLGIVGAGTINRTCLMSLVSVLKNLEEIKVFDINDSNAEDFCNYIKSKTNIRNVTKFDKLEKSIIDSDVISVAAAGKKQPLIRKQWLKESSCLILTGSVQPNEELYLSSNIVFDDWKMHKRWIIENEERKEIDPLDNSLEDFPVIYINKLIKEKKLKENDITDIGDIITEKKVTTKENFKKYMFISGGLPMEDLAWGYEIYQNALKMGIGKNLSLWGKPSFL